MTPCPLCNYLMDPFDTDCRRCHGKGIPQPAMTAVLPPSPPAEATPAPPAPTTTASSENGSDPAEDLEYALLARETGLSENRLYRLYDAGDSLLMVHAGPYDMFLREELEAERSALRKPVNKADLAGKAIAIGARAGGGVGAVGAGIVVGLGMVAASIASSGIKKRTELLDLMTLDELRQEAEADTKSFVIRHDNVEHVRIRSRSDGFFSADEPHFAGFLTFKHREAGKYSLKLFSRRDLRFAADLLTRVVGEDRVERKLR